MDAARGTGGCEASAATLSGGGGVRSMAQRSDWRMRGSGEGEAINRGGGGGGGRNRRGDGFRLRF